MELQELRVKVPPLIIVQMHLEKMFSFEDALVEIRVENNQMMHHRACESLLHICIQFAQDNGQDLSMAEHENILRIPEYMSNYIRVILFMSFYVSSSMLCETIIGW